MADDHSASLIYEVAETEPGDAPGDGLFALLFHHGGETFAISVEHTEGVVDCPQITPLPNAPEGVIGVTSVRGKMTVVVNLNLDGHSVPPRQRLILTKGEGQIGLLADRVQGIVALRVGRSQRKLAGRLREWLARKRAATRWPVLSNCLSGEHFFPLIDVERLPEM